MSKITLYDLPHSPYCARVRTLIYHKQLDIDLTAPLGFKTEEYKQLTVTGKAPALVVANDNKNWILPESNAILNYLEETFPEPNLLPDTPEERAKVRLFMQFPDIYIAPSLFPLFQLLSTKSKTEEEIETANQALFEQLSLLDSLLKQQEFKPTDNITLADCSMMPVLFFAKNVPLWLGTKDLSTELNAVTQWWEASNKNPAVSKSLNEIAEGLKSFLQ